MGPTSSILLERKIGFEEIHLVEQFLQLIVKGEIEVTKSTRDFWVDTNKIPKINSPGSNCQFSIKFDNKLKELEEDEIIQIELLTNKMIKSEIIISAGCNQVGDHNVLGELTNEIAKNLSGLVSFGGDINMFKKGIKEEIRGQIYSIEYNDGMAEYHIFDTEFLENWIKHPLFRMIK